MNNNENHDKARSALPYPLKHNYFTRVVPFIIVFMALAGAMLWFAFSQVTRSIYLEQAMERAGLIADSIKDSSPDAWQLLLGGDLSKQSLDSLGDIFAEEVERQRLIGLKVYDLRGTVIYDADTNKIGTLETGEQLRKTIITAKPTLLRKQTESGELAYETYAPLFDANGNIIAIFELYQDVGYLDSLLIKTAIPAISVPVGMQIILILVLGIVVRRGQREIDRRTSEISILSQRLETFVSASAINAARSAGATDKIPSRKIACTLFHSDVRDFTSFAENNPPERVVMFLNDLMTIQVDVINRFGGDVDKMIGDALLARFDGEDAPSRAVAAGREILDIADKASLARGIGIGIYSGEVISGAVGPEARRDFTVIGDSVNLSARLCSEARSGEMIVDTATLKHADDAGFGPAQNISVKGRGESIEVRRFDITGG